jgi:hypothetical protein
MFEIRDFNQFYIRRQGYAKEKYFERIYLLIETTTLYKTHDIGNTGINRANLWAGRI